MKSHFTNRKYDFFKYGGKSRATVTAFNRRKDKYWFEKTSRKYSDGQIVDFLLANFVTSTNPENLWIGEIINSGERKLLRVDENSTEFNLLVQRTIREIAIRERLRRSIQLLQGTPNNIKETLGWRTKLRNLGNLRKDLFFRKKL